MKYSILLIILAVSACATTSEPIPVNVPPEEIVAENAAEGLVPDMMSQAQKCPGAVSFTAIQVNADVKARFTCNWEFIQVQETW